MSSVYYAPDYAVQGASDFEDVWMKPKSVYHTLQEGST